jgi:hypothetical protein
MIKHDVDERVTGFRTSGRPVRPFPRLVCDFSDGTVVGARALKYQDSYVISMNVGLVAVILDLYLRLLLLPESALGGTNVSSEGEWVSQPLSMDAAKCILRTEREPFWLDLRFPIDRRRTSKAYVLSFLTLDFVTTHEFRHVQAGHLDYRKQTFNITGIEEFGESFGEPDRKLAAQATEMDADAYGIVTALRGMLNNCDRLEQQSMMFRNAIDSHRTGLLYVCVAIDMFFKLSSIYNEQPPMFYWNKIEHPPINIRRVMAMSTIRECLLRWGRNDLLSELMKKEGGIMGDVVSVTEVLVSDLFGVEIDHDAWSLVQGPDGQSHMSQILKTWEDIEEELSRYSYVSFATLRENRRRVAGTAGPTD